MLNMLAACVKDNPFTVIGKSTSGKFVWHIIQVSKSQQDLPLFGLQAKLPVDIIYGTSRIEPQPNTTVACEYAKLLRK